MEREENTQDTTSPDEPTHEATTPPGENETDEDAVEEGQEKLDEAGGGH